MPSASVSEDFDVGLGTWVGVDGEVVPSIRRPPIRNQWSMHR